MKDRLSNKYLETKKSIFPPLKKINVKALKKTKTGKKRKFQFQSSIVLWQDYW